MAFFVEPVIGYRSWLANAGTSGLMSPVCKQEWADDGPTKADCRPTIKHPQPFHLQEEHDSPHPDCLCGLHGWHRLAETREYLDGGAFAIVGACLAWGKYIAATKGFRIEFMQPLALVDQRPDRDVLGWRALRDRVCERYQIPLVPKRKLQDHAEKYGKPMGMEFME